MTIATQDRTKDFVSQGTAAAVPINFPFAKATDLVVVPLDADGVEGAPLTLNSHYSIGGDGRKLAGVLTEINLTVGADYRIRRATGLTQSYNPKMGIAGDASAMEAILDDLAMAQIDVQDDLNDTYARALLTPRGDSVGSLPISIARAGKFLAFDANGDPTMASGTGADGALREDIASPEPDKGAAMMGLEGGGTVQQAINISRTDLKALTPIAGQRAFLNDGKASGLFIFDDSDLSAFVAIDVPEGVYIAPNDDSTGASGAWVRQTSNQEYFLEWFKPALDATSNDLAIINAAITLTPTGGALVFPGGKTAAISDGSVDFRNKGDTRFFSRGGRFVIKQLTDDTPIAYYGANVPGLPQGGKLAGFNFLHATQQDNTQTNGNGLVLYWCSNAIFDDLYAQNCYSPYTQATDKGTASFNVVFDCSFDNIYAYSFTGRGFHLAPIDTAGTPNKIGRMYLNAGGQTAVRGLSLVGQDENIEKLNIENGKFSDALVWNSGSGSSVRIGKLYTEKAVPTSTHRGMLYVGANTLRIDQWQINSTTFNSSDATTVYLAAFFDGVIDIGSFGITGTTLTGPPTLQMFRAFNSSTNPAKMVTVSSVANPGSVAITLGDTRDTLITKLSYPFPEQQAFAASGSFNPDFRSGWTATATLTGNVTIDNPVLNSRRRGKRATIILTQDGTGGRTVTWGSDFAVTTAIDSTAGATTVWNVQWDGSKWRQV